MIPIWKLNKGDLFKVEGCEIILEFYKMDGAYAMCMVVPTGQATLVGLCNVELIQGK